MFDDGIPDLLENITEIARKENDKGKNFNKVKKR